MEEKEEKKEKLKEKIWAIVKETVETIVFVLVAVVLIRFFVGELRWIPSGSMHPTLIEKDRLFVEKITKWYRPLQRGDVIVFYPPDKPLESGFLAIFERLTGFFCKDIAYIKRIIGMPGDEFEVRENKLGEFAVYINGKKLNEPYILTNKNWPSCESGIECGPIIIPKDNYFMMGDNRGNSQDSRYWGTLPKDRVVGRSGFIFWPLNRLKVLHTIKTY